MKLLFLRSIFIVFVFSFLTNINPMKKTNDLELDFVNRNFNMVLDKVNEIYGKKYSREDLSRFLVDFYTEKINFESEFCFKLFGKEDVAIEVKGFIETRPWVRREHTCCSMF